MESSMFVGGQCLWFSWVTTYQFTSTQINENTLELSWILMQKTSYPRTMPPGTTKSLTIHEYWPPRISMIPQYDKIKIHVWSKEINKIQQLFNNNCCSIFLYLFFSKFGQNLKGEGWLCKWLVSTDKIRLCHHL